MPCKFHLKLFAATMALTVAAMCAPGALAEAELFGAVTKTEIPDGLAEQANKLTQNAYERDKTGQDIEHLVKKYKGLPKKAEWAAKEFSYSMLPYRGFMPSKTGANILLEQVKKVNSLPGAEYLKQRCVDELHTKIVTNMLRIAQGLDCPDKAQGALLIENAHYKLAALLGEDNASETVRTMVAWSKELNVPDSAYQQPEWELGTIQQNVRVATGTAVSRDPVFAQVVKKLKKYNRGKIMIGVGSAVQSGAGLMSWMAPGLMIPAAIDAVDSAFVVATGGTEQTKMVNELYYAKRMESRWKRLNEESQLALTAYEMAIAKRSPTLLACAESIMQQLCGTDNTATILGQDVLPEAMNTSHETGDASTKKHAHDKESEASTASGDREAASWYSRTLENARRQRRQTSGTQTAEAIHFVY